MKKGNENGSVLRFAPFQNAVDEGFWHRLSSLKLNLFGSDDSPLSITGFYAPCSHSQLSNPLTLRAESLPPEPCVQSSITRSRGDRNKCSVPGILYNTNTLEGFQALDKQSLLKAEAKKVGRVKIFLAVEAEGITVTAALGFDSFLVICHGAGPLRSTHDFKGNAVNTSSSEIRIFSEIDRDREHRLGCYFCNDVVAPIDSTANCTLDQQCTVMWPGLAPIASALAVELLVGILHHPHGLYAKAEFANSTHNESTEQPLGILPHQIRGLLSQFSQMIIVGHSSKTCSACCCTVVSEYWERGMDFVLQAINHPTFLEDLTGLTELMKSASSFELVWDDEMDDNDNNDIDCVEI
ncbi:unnamed protein product [Camellia sinensis]